MASDLTDADESNLLSYPRPPRILRILYLLEYQKGSR